MDTWLELVDNQTGLVVDNYNVENTNLVETNNKNQKLPAERKLDEEYAERIKPYLGETKKPHKMKIDAFIWRAKTVNNYLPQMNT